MKTVFSRGHGVMLFCVLVYTGVHAAASEQPPRPAAKPPPSLAAANAKFAFNLLSELHKQNPRQNIFFSPLSISTVLQMVCNGAAGNTLEEMNQVLGTTELKPKARNEAVRALLNSINSRNRSNVVLSAANAIWIRQGIPVRPDFTSCNAQYFGCTISVLDFGSPRSLEIINAWAKEKTHGKINSILDEPLQPLDYAVLANAVYFKADWLDQFNKQGTKEHVFHSAPGAEKNVPMMQKWRPDFTYRRGNGYQAVRLPYKDMRLAMYLFLPDFGSSPDALLPTLTAERWRTVIRPGFERREGELMLPRFSVHYQTALRQMLTRLGMGRAFGRSAEFTGITPGELWLSELLQEAVMEVNEEGTEAAAVTGGVMTGGIQTSPPPFQMIVDRPFLFLIHDGLSDSILFMGVVYDPGSPG